MPQAMSKPLTPRIPPLPPDERDEAANELLAQVGAPVQFASNLFATLVRHPGLFRRWLPFGGKLLAGQLPARDRELLILRTAWHCGSDYEWTQHVRIAGDAGVTAEEMERLTLADAQDAPGWAAFDATLIRAADELHEDSCLGDATWRALAGRYDERQLIEVPMLVGHYQLLAFTLNSLGVQLEEGAGE
ncbi:MAG: carboxymuconolactone decarboxylase family protein [Acidimicrobiales bacterium]